MPDQNDTPLTPAAPPPAEAQNTVPAAEMTIPKSRFDEVNNKLKAIIAEQEAAQKERENAEAKRLEEQKEFETLYKTAAQKAADLEAKQTALTEQAAKAEAALLKVWEAKKGIIPKAMASLVDKLPLTERLEWLAENESELTKPSQGTPQHAPPNGSGKKAYDFGGMSVPSF